MDANSLEYKQGVWKFLEEIEPGRVYTIARLAKKENREAFVAAVKEYMDSLPWQGHITFNHDYSKIYKMTPI